MKIKKTALKKTINHFFLHYPSQHAYIAYKHFDEALATVAGNGVFVEALTGSPGIIYNNPYIQGFAEAIYKEVKTYLNKRKEIDQAFLVKSMKHFEKRFPELASDLSELLRRYVIFVDEAFDIKNVDQVFNNIFRLIVPSRALYIIQKPIKIYRIKTAMRPIFLCCPGRQETSSLSCVARIHTSTRSKNRS